MSDFGEDVKKLFFAGVGMVSEACDCTKEQLDKLSKKGNEFLDEQGEKSKKWFDEMVKKGKEVMGASGVENEPLHREGKAETEDLSERLKNMSADELKELKKEIDKLTKEKNAEK